MKAAVFYECGEPEKIQIVDVPNPKPERGQALIQVKACGLNYFDLQVLRGPAAEGAPSPFWSGGDIAGVIVETGADVTGFKAGDRVIVNPSLYCGKCEYCRAGEESVCETYGIIGDTIPGGLAEYIAVDEASLMRLPEHLSFIEGAAVPLVFQTAWRALISQAQIRPSEDVLILGASGGVSSAAIQIAKLAGARVFSTTSSVDKIEKAKKLGADFCLNRNEGDYWSEISRLTHGRGVDVVLESVGAATWMKSLQSLAKGGRLVTIGRTTGRMVEMDVRLVFWNHLKILGSTMSNRREFAEVMELVFDGNLKPVIDSVYPLEQARAAFERLAAGGQFGKIMIKVGD